MWDLLLNEDQSMIVDAVRDYLAQELPLERLRPNAEPIDFAQVYAGLVELGWLGIGLPEEVGGSDLGLAGEMLVQRECGRYLVSPRAIATVLGARVALQAGDAELASKLTSGGDSAALAIPVTSGGRESTPIYTFDREEGDLLLTWNEEGMGLFDAAAVSDLRGEECLDDSLKLQSGSLAMHRPKHWIGAERAPLGLHADVLLAAALIGIAEHACELTVEYAKVREQFGKPIGAFQAVKHRCADMGVRVRLAWYQTSLAALKVQAGAADAVAQVAGAKLLAAQAAHENARAAIQLHGAIGFQAECDVHWFMKRAHVYDRAGGSVQYQARRLVNQQAWFS